MEKIEGKWYKNLTAGINNSIDSELTEEYLLLKNITLDQLGDIWSRKGTDLYGTVTSGADSIYGLFEYDKFSAGTRTFMRVANTNLESESSGTWSTLVSSAFGANVKVEGVNFKNRMYMVSAGTGASDRLKYYETGSSTTDITPLLRGKYIRTHKNFLMIGRNDIKPNLIIWADPFTDTFHSATGTVHADSTGVRLKATTEIFEPDMIGDIAYNTTDGAMAFITAWADGDEVDLDTTIGDTWDGDTIYVLPNTFKADLEITGFIGYGENVIAWDEQKMYRFDPLSNWDDEIGNFGCSSHRSIAIVDGYLIWANRYGIWRWDGESRPVDISAPLKDRVNGLGLWDLVNSSNFGLLSAGVDERTGKYKLSVGTLQTVSGALASATTNAVFVFDSRKEVWHLDNYQDAPAVWSTHIDSGAKDLYFGGTNSRATWKTETGNVDDNSSGSGQDISVQINTNNKKLSAPNVKQRLYELFLRYKSGGVVDVSISKDEGSYAWGASADKEFPIASTQTVNFTHVPKGDAYTDSIKLTTSVNASTGAFGLKSYGLTFASQETTGLKPI